MIGLGVQRELFMRHMNKGEHQTRTMERRGANERNNDNLQLLNFHKTLLLTKPLTTGPRRAHHKSSSPGHVLSVATG